MDRTTFPGKSPRRTRSASDISQDAAVLLDGQNRSMTMGYTPRHAKPGSHKEAAPSGRTSSALAATALAAPSIGRHAAPETTAQRERRLQRAARGGKKGDRRRADSPAGHGSAAG